MTARSLHQQGEPRGEADGLWYEIFAGDVAGRPALFLDRDGVIVEDTHYLGRRAGLRMLAGAAEAIARCNRRGIPVVLVSNQSGIARGFLRLERFCGGAGRARRPRLRRPARGSTRSLPARTMPTDKAPFNIADHPWRKPNPGMIVAAAERMTIDLPASWIVGDRASDLAAGRAAGLAGGILISPRKDDPERQAALELRSQQFTVEAVASLADAVTLLLAPGRLALTTSSSSAT